MLIECLAWSLQKGFEEEISFYTYVSLYLIGVHWEMEKLRKFAINCIGILPKYISKLSPFMVLPWNPLLPTYLPTCLHTQPIDDTEQSLSN